MSEVENEPKVKTIHGGLKRSRNYQSIDVSMDMEIPEGFDCEDAVAILIAKLGLMADEFEQSFLPQIEEEEEDDIPKTETKKKEEPSNDEYDKTTLLKDGWVETKNPNILMKVDDNTFYFKNLMDKKSWQKAKESNWGK